MSEEAHPRTDAPAEERATRARGRRTVGKLVAAAVEEFTAHGYHDARITRIAKRAGTSYGTFYLYFSDKDDVLWEALGDSWRGLIEVMESLPALEPGPEGRRKLKEWVRRACDHHQRYAPMTSASGEAQSSPLIGDRGVEKLGECVRLLTARIRDSDAAGIDPVLAALTIFATLERANTMYFAGSLVASYPELVTALTEFIHLSLFGATPAAA